MKAVLHISVYEEMSNLLNTREAVTHLSDLIRTNPCKVIELDFTNVEFMSRSFADQFFKEKIQLQSEFNLTIEIINANEEIIKILRAVSNTQNKKEREFISIPVYKFSNPKLLSEYLFAI